MKEKFRSRKRSTRSSSSDEGRRIDHIDTSGAPLSRTAMERAETMNCGIPEELSMRLSVPVQLTAPTGASHTGSARVPISFDLLGATLSRSTSKTRPPVGVGVRGVGAGVLFRDARDPDGRCVRSATCPSHSRRAWRTGRHPCRMRSIHASPCTGREIPLSF